MIVVIPTRIEDMELAKKAAKVHEIRAGIPCEVHIVVDTKSEGWVAMHNRKFKAHTSPYYVYSCADYFPGRNWLRNALDMMRAYNLGLVGFNDGKWNGEIATVGLVRRSWITQIYQGNLFCPDYKSHYADTEITCIAKNAKVYGYDPRIVLMEVDYDKEDKSVNLQDKKLFMERGHGKGRIV